MTTGPLLSAAALSLLAGILVARRAVRLWLMLCCLASLLVLIASIHGLVDGATWEWQSRVLVGTEPLHLRMDPISAWFLTLLGVVGASGAIYSIEYWNDEAHPGSAARGRRWWCMMLLTMGAVLLAANGVQFLIAWELFAISGYVLITLERSQSASRSAGWLYLAASHAGTLCLFALFAALAATTGSWEIIPVRDQPALAPLFWVCAAGFGIKAGLFPLHIWLPSAHANAPSHVSALLSGMGIKMGIYGLVRFSSLLPAPPGAGVVMTGLGAVTAVVGIAFALAQNDLKRLLAYSSVENIGIIVTGLGLALVGRDSGAPYAKLALAGALLHVWNHGLFKSLLFSGAGAVLHATGTREMSRLGGLWRPMPATAVLFALGALAVCALPPMNGFVSEWLVYVGLFDAVTSHTRIGIVAVPAIVLLGSTGALALATFVKATAVVFLGAPRTRLSRRAHDPGWLMRGPMIATACACGFLAVAAGLLWPLLSHCGTAWNGQWAKSTAAAPVGPLASMQALVAVMVVTAVAALFIAVHRRRVAAAPTWDCGYAAPGARMQYTSGSFGQIATGWFRWLLRPALILRRPRGYFPTRAMRVEHTPDTVLDRVLAPASAAILWLSNVARRLQHGRLQYYIAYVGIGLGGLAALVASGGKR